MVKAGYPLIMIVDDDLDLRTMYGELFVNNGFPTALYDSAEAALKALINKEAEPKLILLDYKLPGMYADHFLQLLANQLKEPIPVIIVSVLAEDSEEFKKMAKFPAVKACFSKNSVSTSQLVQFVKAFFHKEG